MRHVRLVLFACLFAPLLAQGQGRVFTWTPPDHLDPPFGKRVRKAVVNIEMNCKVKIGQTGRTTTQAFRGTGFLLGLEDSRLSGESFTYLVTNRHVAECWDEDRKPQQVESLAVRVNLKNGTSVTAPLLPNNWRFPTDKSADIAVASVGMPDTVDTVLIPMGMFFDRAAFAKYNIGEGAKILLAGYFYQLEGEHRVQPLIREGILSMIPDAPLITTTGQRGSLYLADVHIFGGNSGSPVFINTQGSVTLERGPQLMDDYRLLGVVSGYYYEDSDFKLQIATTVNVQQRANSGVSMIVPCDILQDLIVNDEVLKSGRESYIATKHK